MYNNGRRKDWKERIGCKSARARGKVILLSSLIASVFVFNSCYIQKNARSFAYHFNKNDKLYIQSFQNNDSLSLKNIKDIQFALSPDSLIVLEDSIITKKFYQDYFEIYRKLSSTYFCIDKYSYNGSIISVSCYSQNELRLKRVNRNGKMQTQYVDLSCPAM